MGRKGGSGMGGGGNPNSVGNGQLPLVQVDENWAFQPDDQVDPSDMRKNPIPFVGTGEDTRLAELFDGYDTVQERYTSNTEVNIDELKTLQPFVLQSGIDSPRSWDGTERPYVVQFEGSKYLIDGNHRVAKAKLDGQKTIRVDLSVRKRR